MATCTRCNGEAVVSNPTLCQTHFDEHVLATVKDTIERWDLLSTKDTIIVAVSGGKDSLATLDVLKRLGYEVTGLFINEGIEEYRSHSKEDLKTFCSENDITVKEVSFQDEFGFTLDEAVATGAYHPCTICGTLRRYLLNKYALEYDVIATGHNLDDESQTIMMNLFRANTELFTRPGPKTVASRWFTKKVKPLYLLTEKQILTYTLLRGIRTQFSECPYATVSYRAALRKELNNYEVDRPGTKRSIVESHVKLKAHLAKPFLDHSSAINTCSVCNQASKDEVCKACKIRQTITKALQG